MARTLAREVRKAREAVDLWESLPPDVRHDPRKATANDNMFLDVLELHAQKAWAENGFQWVSVPSTLAALYAHTEASLDFLDSFNWPWSGFTIDCTGGGLGIGTIQISSLGELALDGRISIFVESADRHQVLRFSGRLIHALEPKFEDQEHDRVFQVAARIALSVGLELTHEQTRQEARKRGNSLRRKSPGRPKLPVKKYVLASPVSVDLREHVQHYIRHGGGHPQVRTVVCGHYRWQAHGPNYSLRKHIWIKPHVRGSQFDTQVIRPHVFRTDDREPMERAG